jgi:hypothetical protein
MITFIESCKESAVSGMEQFLKDFSHVPSDKLNWTPTPTTKSAIQIAAHTALTAGNFAKMLRDRRLPQGEEITEMVGKWTAAEEALTDPVEMERIFRKNTEEVVAAIDTLTPEEVELTLDSSMGWTMPMTQLMQLPGIHAISHGAQLDFLQTCWDDQEIHFDRRQPNDGAMVKG